VSRREFIDWVRGVAVLAMVVWHTADGWLNTGVRTGQSWAVLRFVGGLAAPSFLLLAGVGVALAARPDRGRDQPLVVSLARGLEISLFGYALRLQTWLIDAAAGRDLHLVRSWLPLLLGYALWFASLRAIAKQPSVGSRAEQPRRIWTRAKPLAVAGSLLAGVGLAQVPWLAPGRLPRLLQVDVLQAIGASLVLLALFERYFRGLQRPWLAVTLGVAVAALTEPLSFLLPGMLPVPLAAYLGKFAPAPGAPAPALFPLFPWFAYASVGAAYGTLLRSRRENDERFIVCTGLGGALLALLTSEALHPVQHLIGTAPWLVHPLRVAFRTGLVLVLLLAGWIWAHGARGRLLIAYGRASLRVYWAHLLVAYGVAGSAWQKHLAMGEWAARLLLLLFAMWLLTRIGADAAVAARSRPASTT
jgi:uncharacterized membrane protein